MAWVVNDRLKLEFEVKERCKFAFYARQEISHLLSKKTRLTCYLESLQAKKAELDCYLSQVDGYIRSLECELDLF